MNEKSYFKVDGSVWLDSSYDSATSLAQVRLSLAKRLAETYSPRSILDVGCGDGRFLNVLKNVERKIGIDFSESMLSIAREKYPDTEFGLVDLEDIESDYLQDLNSIQMFTLLGVIHYLNSPINALKNIVRCSSKNSIWVISFRNRLFNLSEESKYHSSSKFHAESALLEEESFFWANHKTSAYIVDSYPIDHLVNYPTFDNHLIEGFTDNHWNPYEYTNWRQFTPIESLHLLNHIGIHPTWIVPINSEALMDPQKKVPLQSVSSFLAIGQK
jgi:ubiquinone/menaquinone biosynthesis C-methylase UbiE